MWKVHVADSEPAAEVQCAKYTLRVEGRRLMHGRQLMVWKVHVEVERPAADVWPAVDGMESTR